jgi:hypothetical protein
MLVAALRWPAASLRLACQSLIPSLSDDEIALVFNDLFTYLEMRTQPASNKNGQIRQKCFSSQWASNCRFWRSDLQEGKRDAPMGAHRVSMFHGGPGFGGRPKHDDDFRAAFCALLQ